ncbi:MAG: Thiol-disulfide oxidoreductase ResA [Planctomycetota bacterium]
MLVDRKRSIRYVGRIDDRYKTRGVLTPGDAEPELANAITDLIAGRAIREPRTKAAGCPLDRPERPSSLADEPPQAKDKPTFYRDVLPFLHAQCQKCHSPNQAGPFDLLTYDDAVEWVDIAIEEIEARRMPPAQIESDLEFNWTKPPTARDLEMLRSWVATGKPQGVATESPQLPPLPNYSAFQEDLGPPDIILEQPEPTQIGAHGNDIYRTLIIPLNLPEDVRLRAIQILPGNRRVVHHALIGHLPRETANEAVRNHGGREGFSHPDDKASGFQDPHGLGFRVPPVRDDGQPRAAFVTGFVPGVRATVAPDNAALLIPAGCDLAAQMHYVRTGKLEHDSSRIALWLTKTQPRKLTSIIYITGRFGVVPPGVQDLRIRGSWTLPQDADFVSVIPHLHQLGRWIELKAFPPNAEPILLLRVPQWDYNWQALYQLKEPRRFPAGTRFEAECSYDNSKGNPRNPFDPPRNVWHDETIHDEMLLPMLIFASDSPLDNQGKSFFNFYCYIQRSRFLKRMVNHRHKFIIDSNGEVVISPNYDPENLGD